MKYAALIFTLAMTSVPVFAQTSTNADKFTGLEIEEHFRKLEGLYSQETPSPIDIAEYKAQYTANDFVMQTVMRSNLGNKVIENTQNRQEFLLDAEKMVSGDKTLFNALLEYNITDITYDADHTLAEVSYKQNFNTQVISKTTDKKMKSRSLQAVSDCHELFRLQSGQLKSYKVECQTDVQYGKEKDVK